MNRIRIENLLALAETIARQTGRPIGPSCTLVDGRNVALRGKLIIDQGSRMYGNAWTLSELVNERGGQRDLLRASSARELFELMHAYIPGLRDERRVQP